MIKIMKPLGKKWTKAIENELQRLGVELDEEAIEHVTNCMLNKLPCPLSNVFNVGYGITVKNCDELGRARKYATLPNEVRLNMALEMFQPKLREIGVCKESLVTVHNTVEEMVDVNYDYYMNETKKLIEPLI